MISEFSSLAARVREFIGQTSKESLATNQLFGRLALDLFALQFRHVKPYQRLCQARDVSPESVRHWSEIPAVPTSAFKEFELSCLKPEQRKYFFCSSGTSGQARSRHFHSAESLSLYQTSLLVWWGKNVLAESGKAHLVMLTPPPESVPHSSLVHMFSTVNREFGSCYSTFVGRVADDGGWVLDSALTEQTLTEQSTVPVIVMGTAFSFVHLLDWMVEGGIRMNLPMGSRVMETGGYKGRSKQIPKSKLHALISDRLGVPAPEIICEYGMSELSSQAYDTPTRSGERLFRLPPWARARVVSPETGKEVNEGEIGLIRIFDLANVWSVMAIQTEDIGIRRGDGFQFVSRAKLAEARGCSLMTA